MQVTYEHTDTYGGEANYSWVKRGTLDVPDDSSDLSIVKKVKQLLGLSGVRCKRSNLGEMIELRPYGSCTVIFISFW